MKRFALMLAISITGCAEYQDTQIHLIDQARKGLTLAQQAQAAQAERLKQLEQQQRKRLDDAFDRDVLGNDSITPEWVIEHRRAYMTGVDSLATQSATAKENFETNQRNLRAADSALTTLRKLKEAELKITEGK